MLSSRGKHQTRKSQRLRNFVSVAYFVFRNYGLGCAAKKAHIKFVAEMVCVG